MRLRFSDLLPSRQRLLIIRFRYGILNRLEEPRSVDWLGDEPIHAGGKVFAYLVRHHTHYAG